MATEIFIKPAWLQLAENELGVSEIPGPKNNPRILEYQKFTTLKASDDEVPWCSAFANFSMIGAGQKGTWSAAARSWLAYGTGLTVPAYGCIVVLRRGKSNWQGHVGFYVGTDKNGNYMILGGNQSNKVSIQPFKATDVLGLRWV